MRGGKADSSAGRRSAVSRARRGALSPARESGAGRGKSRNGAVQEAAILAAAERVFAGAGFGGATMAAIAAAAGLPKPNLHYYFGSKRALYRAVLERTLREWLVPMDSIVADTDPRAALECYIREKMRQSFARPTLRGYGPTSCCTVRPNCTPHWCERCARWCGARPPSSTNGSPRDGWRRSTACTSSSRSGQPRRPTPISRCRFAPCSAAGSTARLRRRPVGTSCRSSCAAAAYAHRHPCRSTSHESRG